MKILEFRRCKSDAAPGIGNCPGGCPDCPLDRFLAEARERGDEPEKLEEFFLDKAHLGGECEVRLITSGVEVICQRRVPGPVERGRVIITTRDSGQARMTMS